MPNVHPTSIVGPECVLAPDVEVGPGCVLAGPVVLSAGVRLIAQVSISGPAEVGAGVILYPGVCLGFPPQDFKFTPGMKTAGVRIGAGSVLREHATVHASTREDAPTTIGERVYMMVGSHVGHDGRVGNDVIMVNYACLAGHVRVFDNANIGGHCGVHQFSRVGRLAFMSAGTAVSMDVPPFCVVAERQRIAGINRVGMRRAGMAREEITRVDEAFREVLRGGAIGRTEMTQRLEALGANSPAVMEMARFVAEAKRAICPGPGRPPRLLTTWLHANRRGGSPVPAPADDDESPL